jgi:hypothetical protein
VIGGRRNRAYLREGRLAALIALTAALAPGTAAAAPFAELPPTAVAGPGTCLQATGTPGEVIRDTGGSLDILRAGPAGFAPAGGALAGSHHFVCAAAAGRPDGTAIVGGTDRDADGHTGIVIASRPAGGAFGAPAAVARAPGSVFELVAAMSERGDALVAWQEVRGRVTSVRAVRRPAGGAFGRPVVVATSRRELLWLTAGISAGGDAIVAWTTLKPAYQLPFHVHVHAAIAPAGRPFGPARAVGEAPDGRAPALAVAGDGRALLALPAPGGLRVAERPPGGGFGAPAVVTRTPASEAAVALGADGRAAIVWTAFPTGRAALVARRGPGAFGPPVALAGAERRAPIALAGASEGLDQDTHVAAALAPDGIVAAWIGFRRMTGVATLAVRTAIVPADGGPVERSRPVGGLRDALTLTTYPLGDGGAGVAWLEPGAGLVPVLLHAAARGGTRPADPRAPTVRVGRPVRTLLRYDEALRLPVTCSAACDVHVQGRDGDGMLSLARAGGAGGAPRPRRVRPARGAGGRGAAGADRARRRGAPGGADALAAPAAAPAAAVPASPRRARGAPAGRPHPRHLDRGPPIPRHRLHRGRGGHPDRAGPHLQRRAGDAAPAPLRGGAAARARRALRQADRLRAWPAAGADADIPRALRYGPRRASSGSVGELRVR